MEGHSTPWESRGRRLESGVFWSIANRQAAINRFITEANHDAKAFVWTADPDKIIATLDRGQKVLDSIR